jgi:hypothetical protein
MIFELHYPMGENHPSGKGYYQRVRGWLYHKHKEQTGNEGCHFIQDHNVLVSKNLDSSLVRVLTNVGLKKKDWEIAHFIHSIDCSTHGYSVVVLTSSQWTGGSWIRMFLNVPDEYIALELKLVASSI